MNAWACFTGYSDESTTPALFDDMNNKCYDKDRSKITPYGQYIVGLVKHMGILEPYPNQQVFRGVALDLKADYPEGRKVIWYGCCSTTKNMSVLSNPQFCGASLLQFRQLRDPRALVSDVIVNG